MLILQVDDSSFDDGGSSELPDGLANFRMSLAELLVEICHFLGSAVYLQKVPEHIFVCYLHNCIIHQLVGITIVCILLFVGLNLTIVKSG